MAQGTVIKTFKSKKGNDVVIRYPQSSDVDDMLAFANALIAEDTLVLLSGKPMTRQEEEKYVIDMLKQIEKGEKIQLTVLVNGKYAGSGEVRRQPYRKNHTGEIGISLAKEYRDENIGSILFQTLIEEAEKVKFRLLVLHCFENNDRAIHMYEKFGFTRSGVVPGSYFYKGDYIGEITMYLPLV